MRKRVHQSILSSPIAFRFVWLILSLFAPRPASATMDSSGTDFWMGFGKNNISTDTRLTLFITAAQNTSGTVEVPGLSFSTPFSVTAGTVTSVPLPATAEVTTSDVVEARGVHVTAGSPVSVYGLNRILFTTDAYLALPSDILGTEYIVLSYLNSLADVRSQTQFLIVGTVAETTVTITPSVTTGSRVAGVPYDVMLNAGDTYQLGNATSAMADLTGTIITSSAPVAVFGSHSCAYIPPSTPYCDYLVEQLPPISAWGKAFVTVPLATRQNGDTFRFLAATDGTSVSINGSVVATLNRGQFHEQTISAAAQISASAPILVAQYSNSTNFDGVVSDPFMMLIPPYEQFLGSYTVTTPPSGFGANFVNVVAPNAAVGAITLDGSAIAAASFSPIGASSGFSGAQVPVSLGSHSLQAPLPFGIFVYGFDVADSYGYPGGQSLASVATVLNVDVTPTTSSVSVGSQQCLTAHVTDQNLHPIEGVRVDFNTSGVNPTMTFRFANADGDAQFCYLGTNVGTDMVLASVGALSGSATVQWQALPTETPTATGVASATPTSTASPMPTRVPSGTPTRSPGATPTVNVDPFPVTGACLQPGAQGLVPCKAGTTIAVSVCSTDLTCNPDTLTLLDSTVVGDNGAFSFVLDTAQVRRRRLVFQATFGQGLAHSHHAGGTAGQADDANQYRVIDFGPVGSGDHLDNVMIDPSSEAAVQLMSEDGLQNYSNDAIARVTQSVRAATATLTFVGLSPSAALMLAVETARKDPAVQDVLQQTRFECAGDCDGSGTLAIDELVTLVNIALGSSPLSSCLIGDADHSGHIAINELVLSVNAALNTCGYRAGGA